jgi:hypothetical protein
MHQNELIQMLLNIKNMEQDNIREKKILEIIEQILTVGYNEFTTEIIENEFAEFAYDLDNYEPNEKIRLEDDNYYGNEELNKKIDFFLKNIEDYSSPNQR